MIYLLILVIGYLIGSISNGVLISRIFGHMDIRDQGSGNSGATNTLRVMGVKYGVLTFALDFFKGMLCALIGKALTGSLPGGVLCGFASVIGHNYPLYFGFKGGKGISTSFGVLIYLFPIQAILAFSVFFLVVLVTRYVSAGSIAAAVAVPVLIVPTLISESPVSCVLIVLLALLAIYRHRSNIVRLLQHKENKIHFRK